MKMAEWIRAMDGVEGLSRFWVHLVNWDLPKLKA